MSHWTWQTLAKDHHTSVHSIILRVCKERNISIIQLLSKSRKQHLVKARIEVTRRAKDKGHTLTRIGEELGRDHSTIHHYLKQINNL